MESLGKDQYGKVIYRNSSPETFLGKGRDKINKYRRAVDTLLVQVLKQNILSVGQMTDKGNLCLHQPNARL